jgi:small subunit ribosomal protein S16
MVVIRLSRTGAKKRPFYHIVVTDSRRRRDSNYIESIGYFNPIARGQEIRLHLDVEKLQYWQGVGAQLSDRVASLHKEYVKSGKAA